MAEKEALRDRTLMEKLRSLSPEKLAEVEDFVDFLRARSEERSLVDSATHLSEKAFHNVWDNPDDSEYDRL